MQRGEIWAYNPVTTRPQPRLRLIISADAINDASPLLICLQVVEDEDPQSLLAPRVGGVGWAVAAAPVVSWGWRCAPGGSAVMIFTGGIEDADGK